jgi:hypothetical protein
MDDLTAQFFGLLDPEHILSFLVVLIVIGIGKWFSRSAWPWITKFLDQRRQDAHDLDLRQVEMNRQLLDVLGGLREEIGGFRAVQEQITSQLLLAMRVNKREADAS